MHDWVLWILVAASSASATRTRNRAWPAPSPGDISLRAPESQVVRRPHMKPVLVRTLG
jgi:hypothetical protein